MEIEEKKEKKDLERFKEKWIMEKRCPDSENLAQGFLWSPEKALRHGKHEQEGFKKFKLKP